MRSIFAPSVTSRLLAQLPFPELDQLRPHLQRVRLVREQVLIEPGQAASQVYFIESGMVTLLSRSEAKKLGVQVAMIGNEGMVGGLSLLDDSSAADAAAVVQVSGGALRMPAVRLRHCMDERPALRAILLRSIKSLVRQIIDTAACNASQTLAVRCVKWLLMAHERMDGDDVLITHEALSTLLGVRRSGVTLATAALQERGLIGTSRGRIRILDRAGLQALAAGAPRLPAGWAPTMQRALTPPPP